MVVLIAWRVSFNSVGRVLIVGSGTDDSSLVESVMVLSVRLSSRG